MANTLAYKCMFYRFGELHTQHGKGTGFDRARQREIAHKDIKFTKFREVYTSALWMVRIYEVLDETNREGVIDPPSRKFYQQEEPEYPGDETMRHSGGPATGEKFNP